MSHQILNPADHQAVRVRTEASAELGDGVMACLTVPDEFRQVQGHFPILFRRDMESGTFSALALFGFSQGENLFLKDGKWDARYRPLALAIQPFLYGRSSEAGADGQVHIDMDHPRVSSGDEGVLLFDEAGRPTPYVEQVAEQLGALHGAFEASAGFFEALARLDLLEPFTLEVPLSDGSRHSLVGFHIIDENRLAALDGGTLAELNGAGHLEAIFMAIASLTRFDELVERKDASVRHG